MSYSKDCGFHRVVIKPVMNGQGVSHHLSFTNQLILEEKKRATHLYGNVLWQKICSFVFRCQSCRGCLAVVNCSTQFWAPTQKLPKVSLKASLWHLIFTFRSRYTWKMWEFQWFLKTASSLSDIDDTLCHNVVCFHWWHIALLFLFSDYSDTKLTWFSPSSK